MAIKEEFDSLLAKLKTERDEIRVKLHLASMDVKQEFDEAEKKWSELIDESLDASDELLAKAKIVGEELKDTYHRIAKRIAE